MNKQYVIFDMDGTLVESMTVWQNVQQELLQTYGLTSAQIGELVEEARHLTVPMASRLLAERLHPDEDWKTAAAAIDAEINRIMLAHYTHDIPLKPGVRERLEDYRARGIQMCVASSSGRKLIEASLRFNGIRDYFSFILATEEVNITTDKRKPDVYLAAAARFGAQPREIAVFEDPLFAIRTAKKAGFYVVGVYDDVNAADWDAICAEADEVIPRP